MSFRCQNFSFCNFRAVQLAEYNVGFVYFCEQKMRKCVICINVISTNSTILVISVQVTCVYELTFMSPQGGVSKCVSAKPLDMFVPTKSGIFNKMSGQFATQRLAFLR